jgi:ParB/RepB/Spo0J family partition protein
MAFNMETENMTTEADQIGTPQSLAGAFLVPLKCIARDPDQPRRDWRTEWVYHPGADTYVREEASYERLEDLAESIRAVGVLQPLVVRPDAQRPGHFIVIAGHRRRRAAEMAGLSAVPVVVRDAPETELRILQLIENLQRQGLTPMDEARAFDELMTLRGLTATEVARELHVSAQHVLNRLRVLRDEVLREAVERRQISATVAHEIKKLAAEGAEALRRRVQAGERVQLVEVEAARAQLAAAGIMNPRRKRPPATAEDGDAATAGAKGRRAPGREVERAREEVLRLAPWQVAPTTPETRTGGQAAGHPNGATSRQDPRTTSTECITPEAFLDRLDYAALTGLLEHAIAHGWNCPGLLQFVQAQHRAGITPT